MLIPVSQADLAFSMAVHAPRRSDIASDSNTVNDDDATYTPDWDEVREAFLRLFVTLLRGYHRYLVLPTKADPRSVHRSGYACSEECEHILGAFTASTDE